MFKPIFLSFCFSFLIGIYWSQNNYHSPLNIPLQLAANFGELRPKHFHMGVDFKTNGKEGLPLFSIEQGYVSRIKISRSGYGKVIYINHPNGITSVYAHCKSFVGQIDSICKSIQKNEQNEEVDLYLVKDELKVKRGEKIAISGNTGNSFAPHLHFELRDTKTGNALNPLSNGFSIADHIKPSIRNIKLYALTKEGFMIPNKQIVLSYQQLIKTGKIIVPKNFNNINGYYGIAIDAIDQVDNSKNTCGIFGTKLILNQKEIFSSTINEISFEDSKDIDCHTDHTSFLNGQDFHKLFQTTENNLTIYQGNGIFKANAGENFKLEIVVSDISNNKTKLNFELEIDPNQNIKNEDFYHKDDYLQTDEAFATNKNGNEVIINAHTLYEPLPKNQLKIEKLEVGKNTTPIQKPIEIHFLSKKQENTYLSYLNEKGQKEWSMIENNGNESISNPENLGIYQIKSDVNAPILLEKSHNKTLIKWTVNELETKLYDYDLYIDNQWYLLEYERKNKELFFQIPSNFKGSKNTKIVVSDVFGNKNVIEKIYTF